MMSRRFSRMRCAVALLAIAGSLLVGCSGTNSQVPPDSQRVAGAADPGHIELTGAGATLPYPLYARWFSEYARKTGVQINYQPIGSGGGVKQYTEKTVDFGASDAPLSDDELAKAPGTLHIPMVLGGVVLSYHLDGAPNLKLTPDVLAGIFLGQIRQWNDPRLTALNPGAQLPDTPITVVHRTDGSGTTAVFTDYLAKVSPQWRETVGQGKSVQWLVGLGAKGSEGVAGVVKQTPGAICYVESAYAKQNNLSTALLQNKAGHFVGPTVDAITAAAAGGMPSMPADFRVSITNADGDATYPIVTMTYLLINQNQPDQNKGKALVDFVNWALGDGQKLASGLDYAPLPRELIQMVLAEVRTIKYGGKPLST